MKGGWVWCGVDLTSGRASDCFGESAGLIGEEKRPAIARRGAKTDGQGLIPTQLQVAADQQSRETFRRLSLPRCQQLKVYAILTGAP